jgi:hypothetical protein
MAMAQASPALEEDMISPSIILLMIELERLVMDSHLTVHKRTVNP